MHESVALALETQEHSVSPELYAVPSAQSDEIDSETQADQRHAFSATDFLDELEASGFTVAQLVFVDQTIKGERVSLAKLRLSDPAFKALTKNEFIEFKSTLMEFREKITESLGGSGVRSFWTAEEQNGRTSYRLWTGQNTEPGASSERKNQRARDRSPQDVIVVGTDSEPVFSTFEEYWKRYQQRVRSIARHVFQYHGASSSICDEDLTQDVSIELLRRFQKGNKMVFERSLIRQIAKNRLTDSIRKQNQGTRTEFALARKAAVLQKDNIDRREAEKRLATQHPIIEVTRIHKAVSCAYNNENPGPTTCPIENIQGIEDLYTAETTDSHDGEVRPEAVRLFIDEHLENPLWRDYKRQRYFEMAQKRFIAGCSLKEIATAFGVTESRISKIFSEEIIPTLRQSVKNSGIGSDDAADIIYSRT